MRHKIYMLTGFLLALLFVLSCTVSKRHYRKGYHVEWLSKADSKLLNQSHPAEKAVKNERIETRPVGEVVPVSVVQVVPASTSYTNGCDVMIFRAGEELEVKVIEVLTNSVKYKYCERPDGPTYETMKRDIFMIKYANGTRELFDKVNNPSDNSGPTINSGNNGPIINSGEAGSNSTADHSGDRSFWVTLVLLLLVGVFGVHRFYLGQYGMGILYLFTFGLCMIGVLVDLILLLTGNLEPEYGDFSDKPDGL